MSYEYAVFLEFWHSTGQLKVGKKSAILVAKGQQKSDILILRDY